MYEKAVPIFNIVDRSEILRGAPIVSTITLKTISVPYQVAASRLKHTIKGDANLVTIPEIEKLMSGDALGVLLAKDRNGTEYSRIQVSFNKWRNRVWSWLFLPS